MNLHETFFLFCKGCQASLAEFRLRQGSTVKMGVVEVYCAHCRRMNEYEILDELESMHETNTAISEETVRRARKNCRKRWARIKISRLANG